MEAFDFELELELFQDTNNGSRTLAIAGGPIEAEGKGNVQ